MKRALLCLAAAASLVLPVFAAEDAVWEIVDTKELERQASQAIDLPLNRDINLEEGLSTLAAQAAAQMSGIVKSAVRSGALVLTIALFSSLAEAVSAQSGAQGLDAARLVGAIALSGAALGDVSSLLALGRESVEHLVDFDRILIPTITAAAAASGSVTGAASRQMATLLCVNLLLTLMKGVLIPMVYLYVAACTGAAAADHPGLGAIAGLIRWAVQGILKWLLLLFTAYLSVSGVIAGTADKAAAKLTRFAISGMVPVVGGILSDATESVLAGAGLMRSAVGVFGTIAVLAFCLTPFLRLLVQYLLYRVAAVLAASVSAGPAAALIEQIGSAFGLIMAMTGTAALLTLISVILTTAAAVS